VKYNVIEMRYLRMIVFKLLSKQTNNLSKPKYNKVYKLRYKEVIREKINKFTADQVEVNHQTIMLKRLIQF